MGNGMVERNRLVEMATAAAGDVEGELVEIGCYQGRATAMLCDIGRRLGRWVHAIDSFRGMGDPGPKDAARYPRGKFDVGGKEGFIQLMFAKGYSPGRDYSLHEGYVPEIFESPSLAGLKVAFAYLDLDHYEPTLAALDWLWAHMDKGGIILCDDYDGPDGSEVLAAAAIRDWLPKHRPAWAMLSNDQAVIYR